MTGLVFVDTNVLVYARQADAPGNKQKIAAEWIEHLWREQRGRTSVQVLNEYYVTLTRKIKPALTADDAWDEVRALMSWVTRALDIELLVQARDMERRYRLNWWDSLIVASAQAESCTMLLSEDLQDRATMGGITIRNPFALRVSDAAAHYDVQPAVQSRHRARGRPRRTPSAA